MCLPGFLLYPPQPNNTATFYVTGVVRYLCLWKQTFYTPLSFRSHPCREYDILNRVQLLIWLTELSIRLTWPSACLECMSPACIRVPMLHNQAMIVWETDVVWIEVLGQSRLQEALSQHVNKYSPLKNCFSANTKKVLEFYFIYGSISFSCTFVAKHY